MIHVFVSTGIYLFIFILFIHFYFFYLLIFILFIYFYFIHLLFIFCKNCDCRVLLLMEVEGHHKNAVGIYLFAFIISNMDVNAPVLTAATKPLP